MPERVVSDEDGPCPRRNWEGQHSFEEAQVEASFKPFSQRTCSKHLLRTNHRAVCPQGWTEKLVSQSPGLQPLSVSVL